MSGLDWLVCPHCGDDLHHRGTTLSCARRHSFDVARQGYVNLLGRAAPANADTASMLDARARFLAAGHYDDLAEAVASAVAASTSGLDEARVVEVGAGTGFYLARSLDLCPYAEGLATDVSVPAAKRAAKAHPRAASIVADTWAGIPVADGAADTIVCVFAPRNPSDFARILQRGGSLVVAQPAPSHLRQLRESYGLLEVAGDKADRLGAAFAGWAVAGSTAIRTTASLQAHEVHDLIAMGPNAFHGLPAQVEACEVEIAIDVIHLTVGDDLRI